MNKAKNKKIKLSGKKRNKAKITQSEASVEDRVGGSEGFNGQYGRLELA